MDKQKLEKEERDYIKDTKELKKYFKSYITKYYGKPCKDKCSGCSLCRVWTLYDLINVSFFS